MARATDTDVRAYVDVPSAVDTSVYINAAVAVVTDKLTGKGLSESILTQIEIFLAAHFATLAVERGGLKKETAGDSSQSYQTISEKFKGFTSTRFGQQAITLDTSGTLAADGNANQRAILRVVGSATTTEAS